jgi:hypothetical protein
VWVAPVVAHFFADFPLELTLGVLAWVMAVVVALTWIVRPVRRIIYRPDAAECGGPNQVAAVVLGFAFIGFVTLFVFPQGWFE